MTVPQGELGAQAAAVGVGAPAVEVRGGASGPAEQARRDRLTAAVLQAAIEKRLGRRDRALSTGSTAAALAAALEQRPAGWRQRY